MPLASQDFFYTAPFLLYALALIVSCTISLYAVKKIIFIADHRKIYDIPDDVRKFHGVNIPSLGGIGIFVGYIVTAAFFMFQDANGWNYIVASTVLLFFTGVYDDLMNMNPSKKLLLQFLASALTIYCTNIRLSSLEGMLGVYELPYWLSVGFTTTACVLFINVFNFIDGIDGLACSFAVFYLLLFSVFLALSGHIRPACVAISLAGATGGLFYYNVSPARIYMGDTGSMVLGFSIFIFGLLTINGFSPSGSVSGILPSFSVHSRSGMIIVVLATLFLPVYDAFRVFAIRLSRGLSPLRADRSHLHYYLLDAGCSHNMSVLVMMAANIALTITGIVFSQVNIAFTIAVLIIEATVLVVVTDRMRQKKMRRSAS